MRFSFAAFHALACTLYGLTKHPFMGTRKMPRSLAHDKMGLHKNSRLPRCNNSMASFAKGVKFLHPFSDWGEHENSKRGAGAHFLASCTPGRPRAARMASSSL